MRFIKLTALMELDDSEDDDSPFPLATAFASEVWSTVDDQEKTTSELQRVIAEMSEVVSEVEVPDVTVGPVDYSAD